MFLPAKRTQPFSKLSAMLDQSDNSRQHDSANFRVGLGTNGVQSARNLTQAMVTMETRGEKEIYAEAIRAGLRPWGFTPKPLENFSVSSKSLITEAIF